MANPITHSTTTQLEALRPTSASNPSSVDGSASAHYGWFLPGNDAPPGSGNATDPREFQNATIEEIAQKIISHLAR